MVWQLISYNIFEKCLINEVKSSNKWYELKSQILFSRKSREYYLQNKHLELDAS